MGRLADKISRELLRKVPWVKRLRAERDSLLRERAVLNEEIAQLRAKSSSASAPSASPPSGVDLRRLHLGCGPVHLKGWCNVDAQAGPAVDVVADITRLDGFPDACAEAIYACHVLEHFDHDQIEPILKRWRRLLVPGGELRISVPDIDRIVRIYTDNWAHFQTDGNAPWIGLIYGGQVDRYDFHKTGFNFCWLSYLLRRCGFADPREYPHEPHFVAGARDGSLAHEPFGVFLSLNVVANRPRDGA